MHQYLLSVVICTITYLVMGETSVRFRARRSTKLSEDHVNKTLVIDSLMMCVALCKTERLFLCQTASWSDGNCLMSETITINDLNESPGASTNNENWITMCRIVYPVFHAHGNRGRYSLTFEEADSRCLQSESRIASVNDLLEAQKMGFELCICGWLSDGTKGFVLQKENLECWFEWHTGILECTDRERNDVYCKSALL